MKLSFLFFNTNIKLLVRHVSHHQYRQARRKHNESFQIFRSWSSGNIICFNAGGLRLKFLIFQVDQKDLELDGRVRNPDLGLVQGHGRYFLQPDLQHHGRALPAGQEL